MRPQRLTFDFSFMMPFLSSRRAAGSLRPLPILPRPSGPTSTAVAPSSPQPVGGPPRVGRPERLGRDQPDLVRGEDGGHLVRDHVVGLEATGPGSLAPDADPPVSDQVGHGLANLYPVHGAEARRQRLGQVGDADASLAAPHLGQNVRVQILLVHHSFSLAFSAGLMPCSSRIRGSSSATHLLKSLRRISSSSSSLYSWMKRLTPRPPSWPGSGPRGSWPSRRATCPPCTTPRWSGARAGRRRGYAGARLASPTESHPP